MSDNLRWKKDRYGFWWADSDKHQNRRFEITQGNVGCGCARCERARKHGHKLFELWIGHATSKTMTHKIGSFRTFQGAKNAANRMESYDNPISSAAKTALYAGGAITALFIGYAIFGSKSASASTTPSGSGGGTVVLQPGAQSAVVGSGITLTLPQGATWGATLTDAGETAPNQYAGTSTPVPIPANPQFKGQSTTIVFQWIDASGATQTTTLTITE